MRYALVHSPVVGPSTWRWVADALRTGGHEVVVPDLVTAARSGNPDTFAAAVVDAIGAGGGANLTPGGTVVVGHSGAGAVLPLIAAALTEPPRRVVFVDAVLPPADGDFTAGGGFLGTLRTLARDGVLPRWSEWWAPGTLETLVPDGRRRAAVEAELPQIPVSFYETPIRLPIGWCNRGGAYVLLSEAYRAEASRAGALGWPVVERIGGHFDIVNDGAAIAACIAGFDGRPAAT
ncbi:MAG: hypothetical protein JWM72_407 [Actinomycetia bacterium]|nr:hypothetical protein [Actinomycetes bacterium]MDQ1459214.1 hypothetical protein [Actinomycetota bacterium]